MNRNCDLKKVLSLEKNCHLKKFCHLQRILSPPTRDADFRILVPLPLPSSRFTSIKNVVILLVAIPPTSAEAPDSADRFRFPVSNPYQILGLCSNNFSRYGFPRVEISRRNLLSNTQEWLKWP